MPHLAAAFNLARWLTGNEPDAEDLVQESVLRAFRFFHQLRSEEPRAWLMRIVRNTYYSGWRDHGRHRASEVEFDEEMHSLEELQCADNNPESLRSRGDTVNAVNDALARLPATYREIIVLKEMEDFSYKEIAAITRVPIGTVMSRLSRGRKLLADYLGVTWIGQGHAMHRVPPADSRLR